MTVRFSVIVLLGDVVTPPRPLIASLDGQSLPYADFEVLFADWRGNRDLVHRLAQLCRHRPNMAVVSTGDTATPSQALSEALTRASGEYVLYVDVRDALLPESLERLYGIACIEGADLVLGRDSGRAPQQLFEDSPAITGVVDLAAVHVGYRKSFLVELGVGLTHDAATPYDPRFRAAAFDKASTVAALGSYAFTPDVSETGGRLLLAASSTSWQRDVLRVRTEVLAGQDCQVPESAVTRLLLRNRESGVQYPLETWVSAGEGSLSLQADLSPRTAALGDQLAEGSWQLWAEAASERGFYGSAALEPCPVQPAIIDGVVVARGRSRDSLDVEVGVTTRGVVRARAKEATITETAAGSVMTLPLRNVHVHGSGELDGHLALARLAVPAKIVFGEGTARLEAKVSGLAGSYALSTQFSTSQPVPMGLTLVVSGLGEMSVVRTPPKREPPAPTPQPAASHGLAEQLSSIRRALPDAAARPLSRIPGARRAYQRLVAR